MKIIYNFSPNYSKKKRHFKDIKFDYLDKEKSQTNELLSFKVEARLR